MLPPLLTSNVPLHLREVVKEQLDEDVTLGTIEEVPIRTKTTWQARIHIVTKSSLRRPAPPQQPLSEGDRAHCAAVPTGENDPDQGMEEQE